jgi:hypothetical protein
MTTTLGLDHSYTFPNLLGSCCSRNGAYLYNINNNTVNSPYLYLSTNQGNTWNPVTTTQSFAGANTLSMTCDISGVQIYVGWLGGGLFYSSDSGATFNAINDTTGGYLSFFTSISCDDSGLKIIGYSINGYYIFTSSDGGNSWLQYTISPAPTPNTHLSVTMNSSGTVYYATINNDIYISTDNITWTVLSGTNQSWIDNQAISCNTNGTTLYAVTSSTLYIYTINIVNKTVTNTVVVTKDSNNNNLSFSSVKYFIQSSNTELYTTASVTTNTYHINSSSSNPPCFLKGSKILCMNSEFEEEYIPIENIRKGTLVKTLNNNYVAVNMIGKTKLYNSGDDKHCRNRLYRCSSQKYPELFQDLIITGCHSILVTSLTSKQREDVNEIMGGIYITDNKYRLMACADERAQPYEKEGLFDIYHIALDHDDSYMNYGIYANGLLVETCSKRYLKELSGMTLIE